MKSFVALTVLLSSLTAFAGPEERIASQECYQLNLKPSDPRPSNLPQEVCIAGVSVDTEGSKITFESYTSTDFFKSVGLTYFARRNEDFLRFKSSGVIANNVSSKSTPSCQTADQLELSVEGLADNSGQVNILNLDIKATASFSNCSSGQTKTYNYIVVR